MAKLRLVVAVVAMAGCYHQDTSIDTAYPEPAEVNGPPGGEMDPQWQAQGYPVGDPAQSPESVDGYAASGEVVASADPSAPGYVMGEVTDTEIDATLDGYGEWVEVDGYGQVWRPYTTTVGVDFTPYETCGSWVWTDDWGWVYGCDWDWGWLPFHYGRWGWFDDYWAWVPDYTWGPAWVDWRGGGGYVGWRPAAPIVRDHRGRHHEHQGPIIRDHRSSTRLASTRDSHWRFAAVDDFGKHNIRAHLMKNAAEGLRVTSLATRPPIRGTVQPVRAASVMHGRLDLLNNNLGQRRPRGPGGAFGGGAGISADTPTWTRRPRGSFGGSQGFDQSLGQPGSDRTPGDSSVFAPGSSPGQTRAPGIGGAGGPRPVIEPGGEGARPIDPGGPGASGGSHLPDGHALPDRYSPDRGPSTVSPGPSTPVQQPPAYHPPRGGTYAPQTPVSPPTWSPPRGSAPTSSPPSRPMPSSAPSSWSPPSRPSPSYSPYSPPSRPAPSYSPPSRPSPSYSPPASYSPPSRPAPSYSPPSRPSPSYSPSSSSSSHSWGGSSAPSHSSGGFSGGSSGGHSSGGFSGGRRH